MCVGRLDGRHSVAAEHIAMRICRQQATFRKGPRSQYLDSLGPYLRRMAGVTGVINAPRMDAYVPEENRNESNVFKQMRLARDEA